MIKDLFPISIQIRARPELSLKPGDFVTLEVIKRITGNKWAVGLKGRVIPAYSDLDLIPGKTLRALVSRAGDRFVFKLTESSENPLRQLLLRQGLSPDKASEHIVAALFRSGVRINAPTVSRIKKLLDRLKLKPQKYSRLIALLLDKKLDISSAGIVKLIDLLSYGEGDSKKGEQRPKKRKTPARTDDIAEELKASLIKADTDPDNTAKLFNHLKGSKENWIIIPYAYSDLRGTIRVLHDPHLKRLKRLVLVVRRRDAETWYFSLENADQGKQLSIFCDNEPGLQMGRQGLAELRAKLQNIGVKCDDTIIYKADNFDGFSLTEELCYSSVDTLG